MRYFVLALSKLRCATQFNFHSRCNPSGTNVNYAPDSEPHRCDILTIVCVVEAIDVDILSVEQGFQGVNCAALLCFALHVHKLGFVLPHGA